VKDGVRMRRVESDFKRASSLHPGRVALSWAGGEVRYSELRRRVAELSATLSWLAPPGIPVGVFLPNSQEFARAVLAVWSSRGVVVPISTAYPDDAVKRISDAVGIGAFVTDSAGAERLGWFTGISVLLGERGHIGVARGACGGRSRVGFTADHAVVFLTSGTTGLPKIVALTHGNLRCNLSASRKAIPREARVATFMPIPMCHSYGFTLQLLATLTSGGRVHIGRPYKLGTDLARDLAASKCTSVFGVPAMFRLLADGVRRASLTDAASRVKCLVNGASAMTQNVIDDMQAAFPNARICLTYGLSEASPLVTTLPPSMLRRKGCSIGRAVKGVDLKILASGGALTKRDGAVGEILVKGESVIAQYMGNPQADADCFYKGYLKTGDTGSIDADGCVYFRGRVKDMINRAGEKVYPCDVEAVLLQHTDIVEAAVVACPHPSLGEVPFAFVRAADGHVPDWADVRRWCVARLAAHEVPVGMRVVESFPKTHTGKIRKSELAASLVRWAGGNVAQG
jgi:acyl-CoA synthetase (AMP-forming)/AMP-acid ligase II